MALSMFREIAILKTAKLVKNTAGFLVCLVMAFMLSRYGMPLYPVTRWLVDHSYQYFSHYQTDIYEPGADPVTFTSLITVIICYALILLFSFKWIFRKIKN